MTLRLVASLGVAVGIGWVLVRLAGRARRPGLALEAALAVGLGLGLTSLGFFAAASIAAPTRRAVLAADAVLLATALTLSIAARRRGPPAAAPAAASAPALLPITAGLVILAALATAALLARGQPYGGWDAWAIWNLRATFLARGGEHWHDAFSPILGWSHPDYPLLLPGLVARGWIYAGRETTWAPVALALLFTGATFALLFGAVAALRGASQGALAVTVLAATPAFVEHGVSQYADVALGFFLLAALGLSALADARTDHAAGLVALAGLALGLAAWTKDEGVVVVLALLLARVAATGRRGWARGRRESLLWSLGLGPGMLALLYLKLGLVPPSPFLSASALAAAADKLADPARYLEIGRALAAQFWSFGGWPAPVTVVLLAYAAAVGPTAGALSAAGPPALALALILAGYAAAYLVSPYPLGWHIATSLVRLLLQLWPSCLFALFLALSVPDFRSWRGSLTPTLSVERRGNGTGDLRPGLTA
jgi:hypothetical protein